MGLTPQRVRSISDDRRGNLDKHPLKDTFYKIAALIEIDDSVKQSVNRYKGESLRFFGEWTSPRGETYRGGSTGTIAYKFVKKRLLGSIDLVGIKKENKKKSY